MDIYAKTKYKDYEETQNIKSSYEDDEVYEENKSNFNIKKIIIIICGGFIFLLLVIYLIYHYSLKDSTSLNQPLQKIPIQQNQPLQQIPIMPDQQIQQNNPLQLNQHLQQNQPFQQIPNQQNQPLQQIPQIVKVYEIKKPLDLNAEKYLNFFPKLNLNSEQSDVSNIRQYFHSKRLYISGKDINYDYIHYIRQNDKDEDKNKQILYPTQTFGSTPFAPRLGQLSLKDFYKLCNKNKLDYPNDYNPLEEPVISIIIPIYLNNCDIIKTLRSIQNQSLKRLEIILVDDVITNYKKLYNSLIENEPRLRIFTQLKSNSVWRKRLDGFLYSRGKYILHINPGDMLADNFVLEDIYNLAIKYTLDTIRFSFSRTKFNNNNEDIIEFGSMKNYPSKHIKIKYGRPDYDVHEFGYGTIWNRLVRANMFTKGLDLVDEYIINSKKNLWEDMWWNDLIDRVSLSNLVVNRLGYIFLYNRNTTIEPKIRFIPQRDKTIREFIYFWYFDYILLPKEDNKTTIIKTLINYNMNNNTFCRLPMRIDFLRSHFSIYERLLKLLIEDQYVSEEDKSIVKQLYKKYKERVEYYEEKDKKSMNNLDDKSKEKSKNKSSKKHNEEEDKTEKKSSSKSKKKDKKIKKTIIKDKSENKTFINESDMTTIKDNETLNEDQSNETKNEIINENESMMSNETKNETINENESKMSNEIKNETINESKMSNETKNETINESKKSNETKNETLNESKISNETKNETLNESKISNETKNETLNENESKISSETKNETINESKMLNESKNETINESKISNETKNESKISNETKNETINESKISNETKNETINENESKISNETRYETINESKISNETKNEALNETKMSNETKNEIINESKMPNETKIGTLNESESKISNETKNETISEDESKLSNEIKNETINESKMSNETKNEKINESKISNETKNETINESKISNETKNETLDESKISNETRDETINESKISNETKNEIINESKMSNETKNESLNGDESKLSNVTRNETLLSENIIKNDTNMRENEEKDNIKNNEIKEKEGKEKWTYSKWT